MTEKRINQVLLQLINENIFFLKSRQISLHLYIFIYNIRQFDSDFNSEYQLKSKIILYLHKTIIFYYEIDIASIICTAGIYR